jgi:nicotinamide-nucleotide amidase
MMYNKQLIATIADFLHRHNETLAVAESVTSGHLQAAFSLADGATDFFQGGITCYNLDQKTKHLHVDREHALVCNCVSDQVSIEMALHTTKLFSCDWSVAITGYAAPVPELGIDNLFAYYAVAFKNKIVLTKRIDAAHDKPEKVQIFYVNVVLDNVHNYLLQKESKSKKGKVYP